MWCITEGIGARDASRRGIGQRWETGYGGHREGEEGRVGEGKGPVFTPRVNRRVELSETLDCPCMTEERSVVQRGVRPSAPRARVGIGVFELNLVNDFGPDGRGDTIRIGRTYRLAQRLHRA
jgi:hypothetical protein